MIIKKFVTAIMDQNSYLVFDEKTSEGFIVDTPKDTKNLIDACRNLNIRYIFITHNHFDHIWGAPDLRSTHAKIVVGEEDAIGLVDSAKNYSHIFGDSICDIEADVTVNSGDIFNVGGIKIKVIACPGHTPGGISFLVYDINKAALFTGDTLFHNGVGRTDLLGGSSDKLEKSLKRLDRIIAENSKITIYPGHGSSFTFCPAIAPTHIL